MTARGRRAAAPLLAAGLLLLAPAAATAGSEGVRVTADVSARRAYAGQRVTLSYTLAREPTAEGLIPPVRDVRLVEAPRFPNFWVNEIETDAANQPGESVTAVPLHRFRLFPLVAGRLRIEPPAYTMVVYATSLEGLVDPMPATVTCRADPVEVDIVALPAAGRPKTFGGAVGRFAVTAALEDSRGAAGEVARVRVEIHGDGNLEETGPPRLDAPDGARVFPPRRVSVDLGLDSPTGMGRAVWTVDVIPDRPGALALGSVSLDYFDPEAGRYEVARSAPLSLAVAPGAAAAAPPAPASASRGAGAWLLGAGLAAVVALAAAAAAAHAARRRPQRESGARPAAAHADLVRLRERLAESIAEAETARARGDARALYAFVLEGIGDLMASLYGVPPSELSRERIERELAAARVPRSVVDRVARLYDHCLEAGYAPRAPAATREPVEAATRLFEALLKMRG